MELRGIRIDRSNGRSILQNYKVDFRQQKEHKDKVMKAVSINNAKGNGYAVIKEEIGLYTITLSYYFRSNRCRLMVGNILFRELHLSQVGDEAVKEYIKILDNNSNSIVIDTVWEMIADICSSVPFMVQEIRRAIRED